MIGIRLCDTRSADVHTTTITTDDNEERAEEGSLFSRLVFVAIADQPIDATSTQFPLGDIDEVQFCRGARGVERRGSTLVLSFPDARMSSRHGRLVRRHTRWILEDPTSKNGTLVDGIPTRSTMLADRAVIELGRTFLVMRQSMVTTVPARLAVDVDVASLAALPLGVRTFVPELAQAFDAAMRVATSTVPILLRGDTGTGKEIVARALHESSGRSGAMVAVNCGALPQTLVESELFGHRRGAFSGAISDRKGLIRSADKGTLFLDEIADLPPTSQAALLRVLQEREVLPIGDDRPLPVDIRLISATLQDLDVAQQQASFRTDLFARLAGHVVTLPRLEHRREDLGLLIATLLQRLAPDRPMRLAVGALRALLRHDWPLNIRELEQALASALAITTGDVIELEHLPETIRIPRQPRPAASTPDDTNLDPEDRELRERLLALFVEHDGNVAHVADALGKQRQQIYKWVKRLAIDLSVFRPSS